MFLSNIVLDPPWLLNAHLFQTPQINFYDAVLLLKSYFFHFNTGQCPENQVQTLSRTALSYQLVLTPRASHASLSHLTCHTYAKVKVAKFCVSMRCTGRRPGWLEGSKTCRAFKSSVKQQ